MKITHTELTDLAKKVFEGMGFPLGDYQDCARVVAWLEMHGLPIVGEIVTAAPANSLTSSTTTQILEEGNQHVLLDAQNNGGLIYGSLALDLAYLKAQKHGSAAVTLQNARFRRLILPSLATCAQRGLHALAAWTTTEAHIVATAEPNQPYPTLRHFEPSQKPAPDLRLFCAKDFALLKNQIPSDQPVFTRTPAEFAEIYRQHLEHGIEIDAAVWDAFKEMAKKVLVPATAASRLRGAGEDAP